MLLHDTQELEDDFGAWSNHDLALAGLFSIVDALEAIVENAVTVSRAQRQKYTICLRSLDHFCGCR